MLRKKKVETPTKTCDDCIHEYACCAWTFGGRLHTQNAEKCQYYETIRSSAAYLIGKMDANVWVSVKDRLPEPGEYVLCYYRDLCGKRWHTVGRVKRWDNKWELDIDPADDHVDEVTHWMQLPKPPKEG